MKTLIPLALIACVISTGCTICASPHDDSYSAFGGAWQRDNETHGRVGSPFSDAGFRTGGAEAEPADDENIQQISYEEESPFAAETEPSIDRSLIPALEVEEAGTALEDETGIAGESQMAEEGEPDAAPELPPAPEPSSE